MDRPNISTAKKLNWFTITQKYWKEQIIFYFLTTISFLSSWFISQNGLKLSWDMINDRKIKHEFLWLKKVVYDFKDNKTAFLFTMALVVIIYCAIVVAHVYYCFYIENKIIGEIKARLTTKILQLKGSYDKKQILNNLTYDTKTFTRWVIHAPNQAYYMILDTMATFYLASLASKVNKTDFEIGILGAGIVYLFLILVTSGFFNFLFYKKDLVLQKKTEIQTHQENILVNNRDLIVKKGLSDEFAKQYAQTLESTRQTANKKDWAYTLAYVIPSYSFIKYTSFFFYPFLKSYEGWMAFNNLNNLFDALKKMLERLKEYPYYFSAKQRLNYLLSQPERDDVQNDLLIKEKVESLNLKKVDFGYEKKLVLNEFSLDFEKGKINQLKGSNGFGKSTIINLIMGLYSPNKGEILVNNKYRLSELNLVEWRKKIAYAEHQNLVENGLSTGQKQLIDLKSLFKDDDNKEIFIFDEANNSLDEKNRDFFFQKLESICREKLVILVSH